LTDIVGKYSTRQLLSAANRMADYVFGCVCVSVCCKQYISKTNLWIFAKFVTDIPAQIMFKMADFQQL